MDKLGIVIKAINDKLGSNIVAINMENISPMFDAFVLCTAGNQRMLQAIKDEVVDKWEENGYEVKGIEGLRDSKWVLIDLGDIVCHVFDAEERDNYNLEKLWGDMPRIDIEKYLD